MPRWAWEFQNEYVLASIMVNGGDILSEDEDIFLHSRALPRTPVSGAVRATEDEAGKPAYRM